MISSVKAIAILMLSMTATFVAGDGKCSESDLQALGMLKADDAQHQLLLKSAAIMSLVGKEFGRKPGDQHVSLYTNKLIELLSKYAVQDVSHECASCFAESVKCSVKHCKAPCMSDSCSAGCLNCFVKAKCQEALHSCVGRKDLDDHCRDKNAFRNYKLQ